MPGGAASELEIAIPQHGKTFETCKGCARGDVLPLSGQFDRILGRCLVDVAALGAFEDPQIRTVATGFDTGEHHAALTRRAQRPQHRNQRWFETRISFGHVMLLLI